MLSFFDSLIVKYINLPFFQTHFEFLKTSLAIAFWSPYLFIEFGDADDDLMMLMGKTNCIQELL